MGVKIISQYWAGAVKHQIQPGTVALVAGLLGLGFISSLGTANTLLLNMEGKTIYAETLDKANTHMAQLRATADTVLATPGYDRLSGKVNDAWALARKQLTTVSFCGEGANFKALLKDVEMAMGMNPEAETTLFGLGGQTMRFSTEQCKTEAVKETIAQRAKEYDEVIEKKLSQSDVAVREKVADRAQLKTDIRRDVDMVTVQLTRMQKELHATPSQSKVLEELENASSVFVKYRTALAETSQNQIKDLPARLDFKMAKGLGSMSQSFGIFVSRFSEVWGYAVGALLFDCAVVWVAIHRRKLQLAQIQADAAAAADQARQIAQVQAREAARALEAKARVHYPVRHLWVPELKNATTSA